VPGVDIRPMPSAAKGPGDWHQQVLQSIMAWLDPPPAARRR
jgi:hypothetical protein